MKNGTLCDTLWRHYASLLDMYVSEKVLSHNTLTHEAVVSVSFFAKRDPAKAWREKDKKNIGASLFFVPFGPTP